MALNDQVSFKDAAKLLFLAAIFGGGGWAAWNSMYGIGPTAFKIDAQTLYFEYATNQVAAYAKYNGKTVEASGAVRGVAMSGSTPVVSVGPPIANIECRLGKSEAARAGALKQWTKVTVRGRVRSSGSTATLEPCELM